MFPIPQALRTAGALFTTLTATAALLACGGDSGDSAASITTPATPGPAPALSTTVTGAVVKGPVAGAQVCGYGVVANGRGAALGACVTTDASGNYTLTLPTASGPLWVEATGGTYTDEATATTVPLPAGAALTALLTANGASITSQLTPLTTLALNTARANVGSSGTLDAAALATATTQLLAAFNLPSTLNIGSTAPTFGAAINAYGTALTAISRMVANGSTLASILAATQPSALAAAYATAANPAPVASAAPSASGSITATGTLAGSITPQANGYEIKVSADETVHRFFITPVSVVNRPTATSTAEVTVRRDSAGVTSVSYADPRVSLIPASCDARISTTCGVSFSTPAGATHPVTVTLTDTPLVGGGTLNGSLVGEAPGAAWRVADLPRTTDGAVSIGGVNTVVTSASSSSTVQAGIDLRTLVLRLADGSQITVSRLNADPIAVTRSIRPSTVQQCSTACNVTLTESSEGTAVAFANTPMGGGVTLNNSVFIGKTQGTLTNNGNLGAFTPIAEGASAVNDSRTFDFNVLGTTAQSGISLFSVTVRGGRVTEASAVIGIGLSLYKCGDALVVIGYPACSGIAVAANGRQFTFSAATLAGGALGAAKTNVAFSGMLTAKGQ